MYYSKIDKFDLNNGDGCRVTIFCSGCRNHCEGCFNRETWNFLFGEEFTDQTLDEIIEALKPDYIDGITFLGGEPFEPENQPTILKIIKRIKEVLPNKTVWSFTGYTLDYDLINLEEDNYDPKFYGMARFTKRTQYTDEILRNLDVLIDGRFVIKKKDPTLIFRGSSNQRIIDMKATMQEKHVAFVGKYMGTRYETPSCLKS